MRRITSGPNLNYICASTTTFSARYPTDQRTTGCLNALRILLLEVTQYLLAEHKRGKTVTRRSSDESRENLNRRAYTASQPRLERVNYT